MRPKKSPFATQRYGVDPHHCRPLLEYGITSEEIRMLTRYNDEHEAGLLHTDDWHRYMGELQTRYNQVALEYMDRK